MGWAYLALPSYENGMGLQGWAVALREAGSGIPDLGRSVHVGHSGQTSIRWVGVVSAVIVSFFCSGDLCH